MIHGKFGRCPPVTIQGLRHAETTPRYDAERFCGPSASVGSLHDKVLEAAAPRQAGIDPEFEQNYPQPVKREITETVRVARDTLSRLRRFAAAVEREAHILSEAERNWRIAPTEEALAEAHATLAREEAESREALTSFPWPWGRG